MNRDRYDLPLTTTSDRAAAHYRDGVDCMLSAWHGAEDAFDKAIAEDPGFALAHIGRARLHQLNMEGAKARAMAAQARELASGASQREKTHVEIMAAVIESKPKVAVTGAEAHLEEYPRDAQVLSILLGAFGLCAFSGRPDHDAAKLAIFLDRALESLLGPVPGRQHAIHAVAIMRRGAVGGRRQRQIISVPVHFLVRDARGECQA